MKDLVYKKNPLLALLPKDESPSGFAGSEIHPGRDADFGSNSKEYLPALNQSISVNPEMGIPR